MAYIGLIIKFIIDLHLIFQIAAVQHSIVLPTTEPIIAQRQAIFNKIAKLIEAAAASNVNIICLAETWN
jgi:beta-ureidopropionase